MKNFTTLYQLTPTQLKKILVIENDIDTLEVIDALLVGSGFELVEKTNIIPIADVVQINPDIIVIDHRLDNGFGTDFCKVIKSTPSTKHIPVILFSAAYEAEKLFLDSCADAFIEKPFDLGYFLQKIEELAYSIYK